VADVGEKINTYRSCILKSEGKRHLWRGRSRGEDNIEKILKVMGSKN
jgi:hypothetical protein